MRVASGQDKKRNTRDVCHQGEKERFTRTIQMINSLISTTIKMTKDTISYLLIDTGPLGVEDIMGISIIMCLRFMWFWIVGVSFL